MNLVFDKHTLRVVSIFDGNSLVNSEEDLLKSMFPDSFQSLSLWKIGKAINYNPIHLKVCLDKEKEPEFLMYRGEQVYKTTDSEKKRRTADAEKVKRKLAEKTLPKSLLRSIGSDTIKMWMNSIHTDPEISNSLKNFEYFLAKKIMPVSWWGPFTDAGGYANMNREIVFRLHNHHIVPKVNVCPTAPQVSQLSQYYISKYTSFDLSRLKKYPKVWAFTPLPHPPHKGKNIFFTMMETESLHPEFARLCNAYADEVWVPSTHNKNVFHNYGVDKPIRVMPLGIDETTYEKKDDPIGIIPKNTHFIDLLGRSHAKGINRFRFLSLFGWSYRKGPDILIKSFVKEFNNKDDVALIIVSRHSGSPTQQHIDVIRKDVLRYAKEVRFDNFPQILLYPNVVPESQMPTILRMGHVFIHTSRGEGFSLPQIEASACGLPVISCNNTGMSEYLREDNAYLITTNEKEICSPEMHWITAYYQNQLFSKLGDDQIDQCRDHLRYMIGHYAEAKATGKKLRDEVFSKYTWKKATERVAKRIEEIYNDN
jgi:glycosyltransferase involved in cell wall biosynthesis